MNSLAYTDSVIIVDGLPYGKEQILPDWSEAAYEKLILWVRTGITRQLWGATSYLDITNPDTGVAFDTFQELVDFVRDHVLPAESGGSGGSSYPVAKNATLVDVVTDPTSYVPVHANMACNAIDIINVGISAIKCLRDGDSAYCIVPAGTSRMIVGITNANQVSIAAVTSPETIQADILNF